MKNSKEFLINLLGWIAAILLLSAYVLATLKVLPVVGIGYQILNLLGAFGLMYVSIKKKMHFLTVLNLAWMIIGLITIINILF
jgi:hypothetical protein